MTVSTELIRHGIASHDYRPNDHCCVNFNSRRAKSSRWIDPYVNAVDFTSRPKRVDKDS